MIERQITIDGQGWTVSIAGRTTVYDRDEFSVSSPARRTKQARRVSLLASEPQPHAGAPGADRPSWSRCSAIAARLDHPELDYARPEEPWSGQAPEFELDATGARRIRLSALLRQGAVALFFYPGNNTPG
jgi:hypothetical protein